jgi:hypothetical protein
VSSAEVKGVLVGLFGQQAVRSQVGDLGLAQPFEQGIFAFAGE